MKWRHRYYGNKVLWRRIFKFDRIKKEFVEAVPIIDTIYKLVINNTSHNDDEDEKLTIKEGGNTHIWNTRGKGAEQLKGMILWWANLKGAKAVPGRYMVHLNVNGVSASRNFTILPDPRAEVSIADMQKQYDFITDINETIDRAHKSIKKIRKVNAQLKSFVNQYKDQEETKNYCHEKARDQERDLECAGSGHYFELVCIGFEEDLKFDFMSLIL